MGKDTSPAVRDGISILGLSLVAGGVGAWLGWQMFAFLGAMIGFLACWLTTKLALLAVFMDRFVSRVLRSSVRVRPSRDPVTDASRPQVDHFQTLGFVAGETLVVVDDEDHVLGGPYAMLSHASEPIAAWVGPVNVTIGSELSDGRLLLTTNLPHVPSDRIVAVVHREESVDALLQRHRDGLTALDPSVSRGGPRRIDPQHMLVADEECEREYLSGLSRLDRVRVLLQPDRLSPDPT